ncbi:sodium:calcium antiporter [Marinobacter fonticola]|uniref:sodium:calcium antiporter n=1 Tax=Marinobacter fonticola TaxID=2603215 RepID=UPI0011E618D9|nr:sodium:calcium antiporter [Marinobacter fonticola]
MSSLSPENWSISVSVIIFCVCALIIGILGTRLTRVVDQLADRLGIGEALAGAVILGAATSLSGAVLSVTAAWRGHPELAISNAMGGIAVQTFFLAMADLVYRRANLEHAAASVPNMLQNALLISLLGLILFAPLSPDVTIWGVHPATPILFGMYIYGIRLVKKARLEPMWRPSFTRETRQDVPDDVGQMPPLSRLGVEFALLTAGLGLAGWLLEPTANKIASASGMSLTAVGVLFTAVSTSIPELVTSIAAVRRGALTLAIGGIIGGNAFDTLFMAASDVAYRDGSIYHAMRDSSQFWVALTLLMCGILMMGLIRRQEQGIARIGSESFAIIVLYVLGVCLMLLFGG